MSEWNVRKPTEQEYIELAKCLMTDSEERQILKRLIELLTVEKVVKYLRDYYITVLNGYVSDSQGYAGQIFTITWGAVSFFTRIIRNSKTNKLEVERSREH